MFGHKHCETCIKIDKCVEEKVEGEICGIINCQLNCGMKFHGCKEKEHLVLCLNVKEPCINVAYGCPKLLLRRERGVHLRSCPASCVACTVEWNRWPLCSSERQAHIPFKQVNPLLKEGHLDLDFALALRDQDMLNHWMNLPNKIKNITRCHTTPRHPAIPLVPSLWNSTKMLRNSSSDDDCSRNIEAIEYKNIGFTGDTSVMSITSTDDESPWGRRQNPPGLMQSVCFQLLNNQQKHKELTGSRPNSPPQMNNNYGKTFETIKKDDDTLSNISNEIGENEFLFSEFTSISSKEPADDGKPEPPAMPFLPTLGLALSIECIPRYQNKPKSMYTFVCGQDFRRDEYDWHYLNWHSEIHGGLDGWIEQRCPLSSYGCSYVRRRIYPEKQDFRIIFSSSVQSFGVTSSLSNKCVSASGISLIDLPFEILTNIARYLDPFSLHHLSLTCSLLHDVALSQLRHKGLVFPEWKKTPKGWVVTRFCWLFSSAFSPIRHWGFEGGNHMSNHLACCPYNNRLRYPLPIRIPLPGYLLEN